MVTQTRNRAALLALVLMGAVFAAPVFANDSEDTNLQAVLAKSDPYLRSLVEDGKRSGFEVIVTGWPHDAQELASLDRASAMEELESRASGFFREVEEASAGTDSAVSAYWPAAPAMKVQGDWALLRELVKSEEVRYLTADHNEAVQLVEPIEGAPSGPEPLNKEGRHMINAEEMWELGYQGEGVVITIIDTGLDDSHEAFKYADGSSRVEKFSDCVSGGCDDTVAPYDDHGHGTHVGGTSLGSALYNDPEWGYYQEVGVAPKATLYVSKFLNSGGGGSWEGGMDSLQWSFDVGSDITSNSWGGNCQSSLPVIQLVNQLTQLGMLSVFAAGNSGSFAFLGPGCSEYALTVGAVTSDEVIAGFSSRGPCTDPDTGAGPRTCPDVVAKGVDVRSAIPRSGASNGDASGYRNWQGTSMATPHVAGAAALITELKRDLTGSGWDTAQKEELNLFKDTAKDLGSEGPDNDYGWGLVQLANIVTLLDPTDQARVVSGLTVSDPEIRLTEQTFLRFHVRNLGEAVASGVFETELMGPQIGEAEASSVVLGLLDGIGTEQYWSSDDPYDFGEYTWSGAFDYSWTDPETGQLVGETIERSGSFVLRAVVMDMGVEGLTDSTMPGDVQEVTWTARNKGNDVAQDVRVEFTVPMEYEFVPGDNFDPLVDESRYADPTPDEVQEPFPAGDVTLAFEAGELAPGESFTFTTNVLPTVPDTYTFESFASYEDGIGQSFSMDAEHVQEVTVLP